jgi:hypothetical protein
LAATGPPPLQAVLDTAATGFLSSAAYDAANNRLLVADIANNVEVLDATTFAPAGHLFIPNSSYAYLTANGGSGFAVMGQFPQVVRFDPVSLKVTGKVNLPNRIYETVGYSQPVMDGSTLYVPFSFTLNGAGADDASSSRPKTGIAVVDTVGMKLVAAWPLETLPLLGLAPGHGVAYAAIQAAHHVLDLAEIDLSTGAITKQVQIPGGNTSTYSNPAVSPDGDTIYLSANNTLYTLNAQTLAVTNTMPGIGLTNLAVNPDGRFLYGAETVPCQNCPASYSVEIVSTASLLVVGTIPSAEMPGLALFLGR